MCLQAQIDVLLVWLKLLVHGLKVGQKCIPSFRTLHFFLFPYWCIFMVQTEHILLDLYKRAQVADECGSADARPLLAQSQQLASMGTHLKTISISNACSSIRIASPYSVLVSHAADLAKLSERIPNMINAKHSIYQSLVSKVT